MSGVVVQLKRWVAAMIIGLALGSMASGCVQDAPPLSTEERVAAEVEKKLATWRARREAECVQRALKAALLLADTMVMDYAFEQKLQLARPARPPRPAEPPLWRPSDTLRLGPFFADTL